MYSNYIKAGIYSAILVGLVVWLNADYKDTMTVAGNSMAPTLKPGAKVKLEQKNKSAIRNGDLVAVKFKTRPRPMLKRVIAIAGDKVEFVGDRLKVNEKWLNTSWWPESKRIAPRHYKILAIQLSRYDNTIPKNNVIVMGDNTNKSYDSGDYGMISMDQVMGKINPK